MLFWLRGSTEEKYGEVLRNARSDFFAGTKDPLSNSSLCVLSNTGGQLANCIVKWQIDQDPKPPNIDWKVWLLYVLHLWIAQSECHTKKVHSLIVEPILSAIKMPYETNTFVISQI